MKKIECPECKGSKKIELAFRPPIECQRCNGTGHVPAHQAEWIKQGENLRQLRLALGIGLRQKAKSLGIPITVLSQIERGMIDPEKLSSMQGKPESPKP